MKSKFAVLTLAGALSAGLAPHGSVRAQGAQGRAATQTVSEGTPLQRLEVMRSRLETMRRSLNSAIAGFNAQGADAKSGEAATNDPVAEAAARLRGLEREAASLLSDVSNLRGKQERSERYDQGELDKLEAAVADLATRNEAGLRDTASIRRADTTALTTTASAEAKEKKKRGFFGRLNPFGGEDEEETRLRELTGTVAPGRDRQLFETATRYVRKGNYETAQLLFQTIVSTYSDSPFLPLAKLAIADTFYLQGTTSGLIQAIASYRDWLAFFPTHNLADDVMLKMAEAEMRQMGLADRDTSHARKAEHQLKVVLQQFPQTSLRDEIAIRLREVQENLALHDLQVARFYQDRFDRQVAQSPRGAQSRLREVVEKYPSFSYMDEVLYSLGMTYIAEEEPDEAAKYFQQLLRNHPNSKFAEKAGEQLDLIGVARPQPDPERLKEAPPERPGLTARLLREVLGTTPVTIDRDGVLISRSKKESDLLEQALANDGTLQSEGAPEPVLYRRPPARPPITSPPAGARPTPTAPATTGTTSNRVTMQPTAPPPTPGAPVGAAPNANSNTVNGNGVKP